MWPTFRSRLRKFLRLLHSHQWRRALWTHRVAASVEHSAALSSVGQLRTIVDIGANRGQFALAALHYHPSATIYSFEPLPAPAAIFRSLFADKKKVFFHMLAIGPTAGEAKIHISAKDDSSSLLPITELQSTIFRGTAEIASRAIKIVPLGARIKEKEISSPALLKLDVQGFELQALIGCESLLHCFSWVYVECSFVELYAGQQFADSIIAWLQERGFRLRGVYNMSYDKDGSAIQADFLFSRVVMNG